MTTMRRVGIRSKHGAALPLPLLTMMGLLLLGAIVDGLASLSRMSPLPRFFPTKARMVVRSTSSFLSASTTTTTTTTTEAQDKEEKKEEEASSSSSSSSSSGSSSTRTRDILPPDMEAYSKGYRTLLEEQPCRLCVPFEGKIPSDLSGTYYRAGPSMFSAGSIVPPKSSIIQPKEPPARDGTDPKRMVPHPFEADGGVLAVTFDGRNNTAVSRFRYVRTNAFTNERKRGGRLYDSMDSTRNDPGPCRRENDLILPMLRHHLQPGLNKNRKNTSNTRAIFWARRLLTLWEGGLPYKIDELALSTIGRSQLGGVLKETDPVSSRAVVDSARDRILMYRNRQDPKTSELTLFEFNSRFGLLDETTVLLPGFAVLSDFAVTSNYAIFVQPPVEVNSMQYIFQKEPGKIIQLQRDGASTLHLIAREGSGKTTKSVSIPFDGTSEADLQFVNAYETDNGNTIVFDAIRLDDENMGDGMKGSSSSSSWPWATSLDDFASRTCRRSLVRYTVDTRGEMTITKEILSDTMQSYFACVNSAVSARRHRYVYMTIGSTDVAMTTPPQGLARLDCRTREVQSWMPEKNHQFCGEPVYVPSSSSPETTGENDDDDDDGGGGGYVVSVLFDGRAEESQAVILRASDIASGPVARISLGAGFPHGLYGCFSPTSSFSFDEIDRRARLADKMESKGNMWNEVKSDFSGLGLRLDDIEEYFGDIM